MQGHNTGGGRIATVRTPLVKTHATPDEGNASAPMKHPSVDLAELRAEARRQGRDLIELATELGYQVEVCSNPPFSLPQIDLNAMHLAPELSQLLARYFCSEHEVLPVALSERSVVLAVVDDTPERLARIADDVRFFTGRSVEFVRADREALRVQIEALPSDPVCDCNDWPLLPTYHLLAGERVLQAENACISLVAASLLRAFAQGASGVSITFTTARITATLLQQEDETTWPLSMKERLLALLQVLVREADRGTRTAFEDELGRRTEFELVAVAQGDIVRFDLRHCEWNVGTPTLDGR